MKLELKNKPSLVLYNWLYKLENSNLLLINLLNNKYFIEKHKDNKILQLIKSLYEYDELKVKLLIYLLWDIEDYYGILDINHYKSVLNMDLACLYIKNIFSDLNILTNIQIKLKNEYSAFYDLELNHVFFNKLYLIFNNNKSYQKNINLVEKHLSLGFDRILDCYDGVDIEDDLVLWIYDFINNYEWLF